MTLEQARAIVGRANSSEPFLSNMIRALSLFPYLNMAEDTKRLEAARIVKAAQIRDRRLARKAPTIGARGTLAGRRLIKTADGWRYEEETRS